MYRFVALLSVLLLTGCYESEADAAKKKADAVRVAAFRMAYCVGKMDAITDLSKSNERVMSALAPLRQSFNARLQLLSTEPANQNYVKIGKEALKTELQQAMEVKGPNEAISVARAAVNECVGYTHEYSALTTLAGIEVGDEKLSLVTSLAAPKPKMFVAIISCKAGNTLINVMGCFLDADLKLTIDGHTQIYNKINLHLAGKYYPDVGLVINLGKSFALEAQNSHRHLILDVKITDQDANVVFQDQASQWDFISVKS